MVNPIRICTQRTLGCFLNLTNNPELSGYFFISGFNVGLPHVN
jgi:hypothetical protein